ncbi:hypothetical protein [Pedobacter faecalis]|uniref:hypothetical protein n=1 Tax=Pedobacter faecalis TaxID=3041495 RepID=UPI002549C7B6|nr:hypothetical protein [Pedobacter sp. ELA7]
MKFLTIHICLFAGLLTLASCGDSNTEQVQDSKVAEEKAPEPKSVFPFYKDIEIRPGLNFEVVSWGKGADSVGGFLILMSDTLKNRYRSFSDERETVITDAWNLDLDTDGDPEIYVQVRGDHNVADLNVYEYSNGSFNKIRFPGLSSNLKKQHAGNDRFMIKAGDLFRTFSVKNPDDTTGKAAGTKTMQYRLRGNTFSTAEVEQ